MMQIMQFLCYKWPCAGDGHPEFIVAFAPLVIIPTNPLEQLRPKTCDRQKGLSTAGRPQVYQKIHTLWSSADEAYDTNIE